VKASFILFIPLLCISCLHQPAETEKTAPVNDEHRAPAQFISLEPMPDQHITELKPGDIIVKPNLNIIPGTSFVDHGYLFGHAVIVVQGATDTNESALLSKTTIFESNASDIPEEYQLRLVRGYFPGNDHRFSNTSFAPRFLGNLYRLRIEMTDKQRADIINFILEKDGDISSYRASKHYKLPGEETLPEHGKQHYWYCSLLIWQAFYEVLGIDLDANKGFYVHPNDLVNSPYFDNTPGDTNRRVRF
jgi:hypothetical protein